MLQLFGNISICLQDVLDEFIATQYMLSLSLSLSTGEKALGCLNAEESLYSIY